jgi:hypothetical protein
MKPTPQRKRRNAPPSQGGFRFGAGRAYADNAEYAEKGLLFDILAIEYEPGRGYEGRDRWALTVKTKDRDPEVLTLGANPKRDEQLRGAQAHLKRGGSLKNKRLRRLGSAYYLADGDA